MTQLRITAQQNAEGLKTLRNSFGVVHAINAEQHEIVGELAAKLIGRDLDLAAGGVIGEFFKRDADRERRRRGLVMIVGDKVSRILLLR